MGDQDREVLCALTELVIARLWYTSFKEVSSLESMEVTTGELRLF